MIPNPIQHQKAQSSSLSIFRMCLLKLNLENATAAKVNHLVFVYIAGSSGNVETEFTNAYGISQDDMEDMYTGRSPLIWNPIDEDDFSSLCK